MTWGIAPPFWHRVACFLPPTLATRSCDREFPGGVEINAVVRDKKADSAPPITKNATT